MDDQTKTTADALEAARTAPEPDPKEAPEPDPKEAPDATETARKASQGAGTAAEIEAQAHAEEARLTLELWKNWQALIATGESAPRRFLPEFLDMYKNQLTGPEPDKAPFTFMFMGFCGGLDVMTLTDTEPTGAADPERVQMLEYFDAAAYDTHGATGKPRGRAWIPIVLDIVDQIFTYMDPADITEADLDQLTADNFHTARHAAEVAIYLNKYVI